MRRNLLLLSLSALIAGSAAAQPALRSLKLPAREVVADARMPLPAAGKIYLFTSRALSRAQVEGAVGLRYLGLLGPNVYSFVRVGGRDAELWAWLEAHSAVVGTALGQPVDALLGPLARKYSALPEGEAALSLPLAVGLSPRTTAGRARALFPAASAQLKLPEKDSAPIGAESQLVLEGATEATLRRLMRAPEVVSLGLSRPRVLLNENSRELAQAKPLALAPYGLSGAGVLVGQWDGGMVGQHRMLDGRVDNLTTESSNSGHATHVAGTILASGDPRVDGFAPAARLVAGYMLEAMEQRRQVLHARYHDVDNHSWGDDGAGVTVFGEYDQTAASFDMDARDLLLLGVKAAGNLGMGGERRVDGVPYDSLTADATPKNILVVGASMGAAVAFLSSRGPTTDGRVKPDLITNGVYVQSTLPGDKFGYRSGTSMATPAVTGTVALLAELYKRLHKGRRFAPDLVRAALLHTTRESAAPGPDYLSGWGLLNAQAAADLILADAASAGARLVRGSVRDGGERSFHMDLPPGQSELRVTLSWLDPADSAARSLQLLHDLDLELTAPSGQRHYPFRLDPDQPAAEARTDAPNRVDNIEQLRIAAPEAGVWTARVRGHAVSGPYAPDQGFVLATSHPIQDHSVVRFTAALPAEGMHLPGGASHTERFEVDAGVSVLGLRVYVDVQHPARGKLAVTLIDPRGTEVKLKAASDDARPDLFAIYPDTKSTEGSLDALLGVSAAGVWQLVVDNAEGEGSLRNLTLELELPPVRPPQVSASVSPARVRAGEALTLRAEGTDPDGHPLSFRWSLRESLSVQIKAGEGAQASATAPRVKDETELHFVVTASNKLGGQAVAEATAVVEANRAPQITAPAARVSAPGAAVTLSVQAQDPDGDPLSYSWRQLEPAEGAVRLTGQDTAELSFTAPAAATELRFEVAVSDGLDEVTAQVKLLVTEPTRQLKSGGCAALDAADQLGLLSLVFLLGLLRWRRRLGA